MSAPTIIYTISDIHGCLPALNRALELVDLANNPGTTLILLGDYVDRGPDSFGVLNQIRAHQQDLPNQVIALAGNHDVEFLDWVEDDDDFDATWLLADADTGFETVKSLIGATELAKLLASGADSQQSGSYDILNGAIKRAIRTRHSALLHWLRDLPLVHETETQIFVHAGIDEEAGKHWRSVTDDFTLTHKYPATTGTFYKTIIAGHVAARHFNPDGSDGIFHDGASHYYIDGSTDITGLTNLLRFDVATGGYTFVNQI